MPTYASGVYNGSVKVATMYAGETEVSKVSECEDTIFVAGKVPISVDVLIIGGGGGGAGSFRSDGNGNLHSGGGGAGGYREFTKKYYTGTSYTVTVGAGGSSNSAGSDSSIERIATGGGSGQGGDTADGGSGGGGDNASHDFHGGDSVSPRCNGASQGNDGGDGVALYGGGGGGGAGASGANNTGTTNGASGGNGIASSITGSSITRAGGGGGGTCAFFGTGTGGSGGTGGGGDGGDCDHSSTSNAGSNGATNKGGGGGGYGLSNDGVFSSTFDTGSPSFIAGGNGGSGIVIIKFPDTYHIIVDSGLTKTITTSGGYTTVQFTAGTGNIRFTDDANFSNVSFIFEDTSTDLSNSNISMTFGSDTSLDSFAKVGTHSMKFTPSGTSANNRVTLATDSDLDMEAGNFTFECWFYLNDVTQDAFATLVSTPNGDTNTCLIYRGNNTLNVYNGGTGLAAVLDFEGTTTITKGQWNHVALTRNGNTMTLWINGSSDATHTAGASEHYSFSGAAFGDFINNTFNDNEWNGYIDHVRITKGVARYTSSFTPTTDHY